MPTRTRYLTTKVYLSAWNPISQKPTNVFKSAQSSAASVHVFPDSRRPHCPRLKAWSSPVLAAGPPTFEASLARSRPPLITSSKPLSLRRPFLSGRDASISLPPRFPRPLLFPLPLYLFWRDFTRLASSASRLPLLSRPFSLRSYSFLSVSSLP